MLHMCKTVPRPLHFGKRRYLKLKKDFDQLKNNHKLFIFGFVIIIFFLLRNFWLGGQSIVKQRSIVAKLLVDDLHCKILNLEPQTVEQAAASECPYAACNPFTKVVFSNTESKATVERTKSARVCHDVHCCAVAYSMPRRDNEEIRYPIKNCYQINTSQPIQPTIYTEVLETICTDLCDNRRVVNYHPLIMTTPKVTQKINAWKKIPLSTLNKITNVIFITIENLTRNTGNNFLWKTISKLSRQGFTDMKGYSMVEESKKGNFLAATLGLNLSTLSNSCSVKSLGVYDGCPFIWKEFRNLDYLTLYLDEIRLTKKHNRGFETFSNKRKAKPFSLNTDFIAQPTDYYIPPYFIQDKMIVNQQDTELYNSFASTSSQDFILNYAQTFLTKFAMYPSLSILRLNPSSPEEMTKLDVKLSSFVESLKAFQKNSLIIVSSNIEMKEGQHETYNQKNDGSENDLPNTFVSGFDFTFKIDSGFERPLLYVSLPAALKSYEKNLKLNSKRLSTVFDVHQTFHHVLIHSCVLLGSSLEECVYISSGEHADKNKIKKSPVGSSLLETLQTDRLCGKAHVPASICPCNNVPSLTYL